MHVIEASRKRKGTLFMTAYFADVKDFATIRRSYNVSRAELARLLNVAPNTIKNYETGRTEMPLPFFLKLCCIFDVEPNDFIVRVSD